ncbi:hypothetical protein SEVIR_5G088900v4 [Setaria viridis]|uniref:AAA+ ATPase domain-containing protein n=1 Tax=Setaria viridis TaxID=4556 RepID=A0A4U6UBI5_SETVI|nr:disease resistance protein PIK6-NP-like isoform X1 [Setaria viridis]XP_034594943.1 disease resistance protein PIK6-NP-like isoform X1 [Setaria viridis]XP_034594944.1 disease resistance protein PIK6-NP-like isoform X1 [Setaria viridis]TKW13260.1 hypothetical protein SEVIR_5G088900v2 [Setaria viridis]TKW13261.1 hypothetical protein SEVIR_5G088900v2 [Setaria viridis]TKW13262.1 hypothetical protein SEVIR_5G088900v2 [Setaria viridis]TKW13263.1 hypothetical protein SEVIR_5G088900v2 [Setaria viri
MDLVTGAMGCLAPKLLQLLQDEYNLQKGVRKKVEFLSRELESIHAALRKVAEVPWDQLDEQVKVWARQVREASYDMEDVLDTFHVRVEGDAPADPSRLKRAMKKMRSLFSKGKARHDIASAIEDIKKQLQEVADRRARYKVDEIMAKPVAKTSTIDPRLATMYSEVTKLIGIDKSRGQLISMLSPLWNDNEFNKKMKVVSVVGVGGLGKTTLAKAVYDELKPQFDCWAFVPVGRNPDLKKVFRDILIDLDKETYMASKFTLLDERQLINELHHYLGTKRYFVVIDDVWETQSWEVIKLAFVENNNGSRIITTTRKLEVATNEVYELPSLSYGNSKKLFYTRIFGGEDKCIDNQPDEVSEKILKKCDGVPLAIITMASLLVGKPREEWSEVNSSIGLCLNHNRQVEITMRILSFSYYDMPSHLRTCLLYLSAFPEEYVINKVSLIWKWVAENFVHRKQGTELFEVGEGYFNDLINRSMIQAVKSEVDGIVYGCRVHDMVLDLLRSLSHEENFVTILYNNVGIVSGSRVRRLALQGPKHTHQVINHMDMTQVRSVITYRSEWVSIESIPSFKHLRVLFLEGTRIDLQHIGNLVQLRYLGLRHVYVRELPKEIGSLKFLETLDLEETGIIELPSSVGLLTQLICLRAWKTRIPNGILKKLKSLEELQIYPAEDEESKGQLVKDLGYLGELRVLRTLVSRMGERVQYNLMQSLRNLNKIQCLTLVGWCRARDEGNNATWEAAVLPRHLRHLILENIHFSWLPSCINPSRLPNLSHLDLFVAAMEEQALESLGRLPRLYYLKLSTWSTVTLTDIASNGLFQKLRSLSLVQSMVQFVLNKDSRVSFTMWNGVDAMTFDSKMKEEFRVERAIMPNLKELEFLVPLLSLMHENGNCDNLGLEQLISLNKVTVHLRCESNLPAHEKEIEAEVALRHAADVHPNRPTLSVLYSPPLSIPTAPP